jgi:hypothetical protein
MDGTRGIRSALDEGSYDSATASIPGNDTLLSALTNAFEWNKYTDTATPRGGPRPRGWTGQEILGRAKDDTIPWAVPSNRSILKVLRRGPLRQNDVDALLGTSVAPARIDRKLGDGRLQKATETNVRFLLGEKVRDTGEEGNVAEQIPENGDREVRKNDRYEGIKTMATGFQYAERGPSKNDMFSERLETMFGPGNHGRGMGNKPKKVRRLSIYLFLCFLNSFAGTEGQQRRLE